MSLITFDTIFTTLLRQQINKDTQFQIRCNKKKQEYDDVFFKSHVMLLTPIKESKISPN